MQIQGQAALVTGGASGLGEATARALAAQGAKVAVLDRNAELAEKVASEIGGVACPCDITDAASVQAAIDKAAAASAADPKGPAITICIARPPEVILARATGRPMPCKRAAAPSALEATPKVPT